MNNFNIDKVIESINLTLVRNRRYLSDEDIVLLRQCLKKLRWIKKAILKKSDEIVIQARLVKVVKDLDFFFGLSDDIKNFLDLP